MILYLDELIPGNVLGRAERKSWAFYASFTQFSNQLCHSHAWLTLAIARSHYVANLEGGVSQIVSTLLKAIFCNPMADPSHGILLKHPSGDIRLYFKFSILLADGAAQKQAWGSKGDSGSKFCFLCANVRAHGTTEDQMHCNIKKYNQLVLTTDAQVLQSYQNLSSRRMTSTKQDFQRWEQATGWTWSAKALMLDEQLLSRNILQPCQQFVHDYMHGILQGTGPVVLYHFLEAMEAHIQPWAFLEGYFPYFHFPKAWKCNHVHAYFSKKKATSHKNNQKISCQASEILAMFPVVRHFVYTVVQPRNHCPAECLALLAMAMAIDQVHDGNQAGVTTRDSLLAAMEDALDQFARAFAIPLIKKWHWMLHLPDSLARHGLLPNCFASERKHKPIGALANNLQNQNHFEQHLLGQVVAKEISLLDQPNLFPEGVFLLKAKDASKKVLANLNLFLETPVDQALSSHFAKVRGDTCSSGDVVLYHVGSHVHPPWQVSEVKLHFTFQGHATTLVNAWDLQQYLPSKQYAICTVSTNMGFIPTEDILAPVVWTKNDAEAKVPLPYQIYSKDL